MAATGHTPNSKPKKIQSAKCVTADLALVARTKARKGLKVFVVLPACNEEETIRQNCILIKDALMTDGCCIIDELIVIDSNSIDNTSTEARAGGATVYVQKEIAKDIVQGNYMGKGDAMWKSLFVTQGAPEDIVCFCDSDLQNLDPVLNVAALVAPMIMNKNVHFTKRGSWNKEKMGAGRSTETIARPFINMFWPEFRFMTHPLAGEWAGRRGWLEKIEWPVYYAIEFAVIVGYMDIFGNADGAVQINMQPKKHQSQNLRGICKQTSQNLQWMIKKIGVKHDCLNKFSLLLPSEQLDDKVNYDEVEIENVCRPSWETIRNLLVKQTNSAKTGVELNQTSVPTLELNPKQELL